MIGAKCALIWVSICSCVKRVSSQVSSHPSLLNLLTFLSELILFAANLIICLLCTFYFFWVFYDKRKLACKFRRLQIFILFAEETDVRKSKLSEVFRTQPVYSVGEMCATDSTQLTGVKHVALVIWSTIRGEINNRRALLRSCRV